MTRQQGDVRLFQTVDGGDILVELGLVAMNGGLETAAYLSLFGGNETDPGGDDRRFSWWSNFTETDPARAYRSETQHLLVALVMSPANLRRVEDAAERDLAWMVPAGVASEVAVSASVEGLNTLRLDVRIVARGEEQDFVFSENWKAS